MIVYAVLEGESYVGFSLTDDLARDQADYSGTPLQLVSIATADEQVARNIVDYLTYVNTTSGPYDLPSVYGIPDNEFTLTQAGLDIWPNIFIGE